MVASNYEIKPHVREATLFELNPFALPPFFSALLIITIGIYVLLRNPKSEAHRGLLYFCVSVFIWLLCYSLLYSTNSPGLALTIVKISSLGVVFIPFSNFYFNVSFLRLKKKDFLTFTFTLALLFVLLSQTEHFYDGIDRYYWGYYPIAGPLHAPFLFFYISLWFYGVWLLYREMKKYKKIYSFVQYNETRNVLIAWIGASFGIVDFLPKYGIPIYPFAFLVALYWVFISAFSILRHKLSKRIYFISRKFLIYSFCFIPLFIIFMINYSIYRKLDGNLKNFDLFIVFYLLALLTGSIIRPVYKKMENWVDGMYFYEYHERNTKLSKITRNLIASSQINQHSKVVLEDIYSFFRIVRISLHIYDPESDTFRIHSFLNWGRFEVPKVSDVLLHNNEIPVYLKNNNYIIFDELSLRNMSHEVKSAIISWMLKNSVKLCIPLKQDKLYGFIAMGEKESGLPYTFDEIEGLVGIASILSVNIRNEFLLKSQNMMSNAIKVLEDISNRDSMTGMFVRKKSLELLHDMIECAKIGNFNVSVVLTFPLNLATSS